MTKYVEDIETKGNADNLGKAIEGLDQFTKNWCMNCSETNAKRDLVFRCDECEFRAEDGKCFVKMFANHHESNFDMSKFGSMSR